MSLDAEGLKFSYSNSDHVLRGLDLHARDSELYTVLGRSGSGKSTLLNIIAGFLRPRQGRILVNGNDVTDLPPEKRRVGMVFQNYSLFPHMNVLKNVTYGVDRKLRDPIDHARRMLSLVGLEGFEGRSVAELSGGQAQRVALARALAHDPDVLLLDEPLSALDASLRENLRTELRGIIKERGLTTIYVTHDQGEALAISDRIGLIGKGKMLEEGRADTLYWNPVRRYTASFLGMKNIFRAGEAGSGILDTPFGKIPWMGKKPRYIGFRPESIVPSGNGIELEGLVTSMTYRGSDILIDVIVNGYAVRAVLPENLPLSKGKDVKLVLPYGSIIPLK
ncbi:MAG: ABC transporter ATP-binding protein [Thermoplasmatota archaeon]